MVKEERLSTLRIEKFKFMPDIERATMSKVLNRQREDFCNNTWVGWGTPRDLDSIICIDEMSFNHGWSEEDFRSNLKRENARLKIVRQELDYNSPALGYLVYELHETHIRLLRLATSPDFRRLGLAAKIINNLIETPRKKQRKTIIIDVRETNLSAQLFFQKLGFHGGTVLRKYFEDSNEDAFVMKHERSSK